jgi:predicted nucleotidyltransferase
VKRDEMIATLRAHERELKELGIQRLGLFGSVARGDDGTGSDVDVLVAFDEAQHHSLIDVVRVQRTLRTLLGTDVDVAVEPIQTARFRTHVEQDLVRAF